MRFIATAFLLCLVLQACGSKGALYMPPETSDEQQSHSNKQK